MNSLTVVLIPAAFAFAVTKCSNTRHTPEEITLNTLDYSLPAAIKKIAFKILLNKIISGKTKNRYTSKLCENRAKIKARMLHMLMRAA